MIGRCRVCQRAVLEEQEPVFYLGQKYHDVCFRSYLRQQIERMEAKERRGDLTTVEEKELREFKEIMSTIAHNENRRW